MARTTPVVQAETVTWSRDRHEHQLTVGTPAWYAWLEEVSTFAFVSDMGTFTARKEPGQHGGAYWKAYRKREGKLHRAYLGKSHDVTLQRLNAVAAQLSGQADAPDRRASGNEALQSHQASITPRLPNLSVTQRLITPESLPKHNLPLQLTSLVGREQDVAAAVKLLWHPEVRLLTLTGPAGVGKTRLALQVAAELSDHFTDSVFFVDLAPVSDPDLVVLIIAQTLGIQEVADQSLLERLKEVLRQKQVLLLLDNFEQVVSASLQVADLLATCSTLKVMVTSRMVLHVRAEREFPVPPLALPDPEHLPDLVALSQYEAVALFIQRVQAVKPDFQLTNANASTVAEICARLDGLPLAIELAAARMKLLSPQALFARLGQRLQVLTNGARDMPARQQTLRNTIAWSYNLLDAQEQRLFRRLAVFVGGCVLEAVEAVCEALGDETSKVFDGVASLIDKSLVQQREQEDGELRLVMLETIREYALERLEASGEAVVMRRRHATFFLGLSEEADLQLRSAEQAACTRRLEAEHDNLRAALRWTLEHKEAEMGLRLVGALFWFWRFHNHIREGRSWLEQVLVLPGTEARSLARAKALRGTGLLAFSQGDFTEAHRLLEESMSISREVGATGKREFAQARSGRGHVALLQGKPDAARELSGESVRLFREVGEHWGLALALYHLGKATVELGDPMAARSFLEESVRLFRIVGDRQLLAQSLNALGLVVLRQGDAAMTHSLVKESLAIYRETGDQWGTSESLSLLARMAAFQSDYAMARALYEESLAIASKLGNKALIAPCLEGLADVAVAQGEPVWAVRLWSAAEALREAIGVPIPLVEHIDYERTGAGARARLGEQAFAAAWAEGRNMSLDHVLANQVPAPSPTPALTASPSAAMLPPASDTELTPREMDVLRLLTQGLTSAQIAEQLVIGVVTVNFHVRSIYSKLGVSSRSAATRYALEHRLV